jgi:aspartyl-tRNA(Asn)/glutamyl-tRNA(Gln) amidotransferase subunit B
MQQPDAEPEKLAASLGLIQTADADFLLGLAQEIVAAFPDKAEAYRKGKKGLLGFFMGELMKRSKGQAEPKSASEALERLLG